VYQAPPYQAASQPPNLRRQKKPFTLMKKMQLGCLVCLLVLLFIVIVVLSLQSSYQKIAQHSNAVSNDNDNTARPQVSMSPAPAETAPDPNSPDYHAGYRKGFIEGQKWAREIKNTTGIPYPLAISVMASHDAEDSKAGDKRAWQSGWESGFTKGYRTIKPSKVREEDFEPLSWANAKPRAGLYDNEGRQVGTIIAVNEPNGIITVKYGAEGRGAVEDKLLAALSHFWFVRKDDPALRK
jgi:hypothetical protein